MKVKMISVAPDYLNGGDFGPLTLGKIYDCEKISVWNSAYIVDDDGIPSILVEGEYMVVEDEQ